MVKKVFIKSYCLGIFLFISSSQFAQDAPFVRFKRHDIKIPIISLTAINLLSYKLGYEYHCRNGRTAFETELGYTYRSNEDGVPTEGYLVSASINQYAHNTPNKRIGVKFNPFYQKLFMYDYLRYVTNEGWYKNYSIYKKTHYIKERSGVNFITNIVFNVGDRFIYELNFGFGIIGYKTTVPDNVAQTSYRNGLFYGKDYIAPNIVFALKMGYSF